MLPVNSVLTDKARLIFPARPLPDRVLFDENDNSEFSEDIRNRFISKQWISVTLDDWINTAGIELISSYMTPGAFHYYLPALLCATLDRRDYFDWGLKAILPYNNARKPKGEWWESYFSCFSSGQKAFLQEYILQVLECIASGSEEEHLAQIALEEIWV